MSRTLQTSPRMRRPQGQAMTEFLVALAVLLPLFIAVTFAGRYGDLQQQATQASRYAAFQRVMQPDDGKLSVDKIRDQMRARFFVGGTALHGGAIQSDDTAGEVTPSNQSPMWRDLRAKALLASPADVTLKYVDVDLDASGVGAGLGTAAKFAGKSWNPAKVAQVEVSLANKMDLNVDKPKMPTLKLAAATAAAPDALGSAGAEDTREAAETLSVKGKIPGLLEDLFDVMLFVFEPCAPDLNYDPVDVVPPVRLKPYVATPKPCH